MTWVRWNARHSSLRKSGTKTRWHLMHRGVIACNIVLTPQQEGREYTEKPQPAFMCPACERIAKREVKR